MNAVAKIRHTLAIVIFATAGILLAAVPSFAAQTIFVSILPQQYFVEKIAGDLAEVHVLVMPGASPHTYEPTPKQMTTLAKASAYFAIGVEFEGVWLPRLKGANSNLRVIPTQAGITKIPMAESHEHEDHGHEHEEGILDPHIWLAPGNAKAIARNTCQGLISIDPANEGTYKANLAALLKEIDNVNTDIENTLSRIPQDKRAFMVFHPTWGYFAKQYDLEQVPIESKGNEPSPRSLAEIIKHGKELGIKVIFVQPQFSRKSAQVIAAELDAQVIPLDPLAEDWEQNMRAVAKAFEQALL